MTVFVMQLQSNLKSIEELSQRMEEVAKMYGMDVPALEEELKKNKNLENFK